MSGDFSDLASQVLSQDEIESLLEQFSGDEDESTDPVELSDNYNEPAVGTTGKKLSKIKASNLPRLNFRVPHYLKKRQLRFLEVRHDLFARRLTDRLSLYLRKEVKLELLGFNVSNYGEVSSVIDSESYLAEMAVDPFPVHGIFQLPVDISLVVIDRMLGGNGDKSSGKPGLTEIEVVLLDQLVGHIMDQWAMVWEDLVQCKHKIVGHESEIQHLHITSPHNPVTIATFRLKISTFEGDIRIIFPGIAWEPIMSRVSETLLAQTSNASKPKWNNEAMLKLKVKVQAKWDGHQISAKELAGIKPGDFLYFNKSLADKTTVLIADLPKFTGQVGQSDGKRAIKVDKILGNTKLS